MNMEKFSDNQRLPDNSVERTLEIIERNTEIARQRRFGNKKNASIEEPSPQKEIAKKEQKCYTYADYSLPPRDRE